MDERPPAGERTAASTSTGYALLVATVVALALSIGVLGIMRRAAIVAVLVGWKWLSAGSERREGGLGYFVLHVLPQLIVVGPPLSAAVALVCCIHFVSRGGALSRRAKLVWMLALAGATAGWPVACSCVSLQGLAEAGEPLNK